MIRTVPIPGNGNGHGCAPGADCCDSCRSHKPAAAATRPAIGTHRNSALHARLGDTVCDELGNCIGDNSTAVYSSDTPTVLSTTVTATPGTIGATNPAWYFMAALAIIALIELTGPKKGR